MPRARGFRAPGPYPAVGGEGEDHDAEAHDGRPGQGPLHPPDRRPAPPWCGNGVRFISTTHYPVPIVVDRELGLLLRLAYARRNDRAMIIPDCFPV